MAGASEEKRIGDYLVGKHELGRGTYGKVYLGTHVRTGKHVAAKKFTWEKQYLTEEAEREANLLMRIPDHEHLVKLLDYVKKDTEKGGKAYVQFWMIVEYCPLGHLQEFAEKKRLSVCEKVDLATQCAHAVYHLHSQVPSVIHRDIKAKNILVVGSKKRPVVKLADFGESKLIEKINNETQLMSSVRGTTDFMAPEMFAASPSYNKSADVFSLGVTFLSVLDADSGVKVPKVDGACLGRYLQSQAEGFRYDITKPGDSAEVLQVKGVLSAMLEKDPASRLQIQQLLEHLEYLLITLRASQLQIPNGQLGSLEATSMQNEASIRDLEGQVARFKDQIQLLELAKSSLESQTQLQMSKASNQLKTLEAMEAEKNRLAQDKAAVEQEKFGLKEELVRVEQEKMDVENEKSGVIQNLQMSENTITQLENEIRSLHQDRGELSQQLGEVSRQKTALTQELISARKEIGRQSDTIIRIAKEKEELTNDKGQLIVDLTASERECRQATESIAALTSDKQGLESALFESKALNVSLESRKEQLEEENQALILRKEGLQGSPNTEEDKEKNRTVIIKNIPPKTDVETMKMFLANKRCAGGTSVEDIRMKGRTATVTFTSYAARTIKVEGVPSSVLTDDLEDYFSSEADSGGGLVESISKKRGSYTVVFEEEEVVARVLEKKHVLKGNKLRVMGYK